MEPKPKVLLYEPIHEAGTKILAQRCELVYADSLDEARLLELVGDVSGILIRFNGKVTRRIMEAAPGLRVIGRHGVGLENVDLQAAKERNIQVVYTPQANAVSVAEHFLGLALALAKHIPEADQAVREGRWNVRHELVSRELHGKTLGILGLGRIGMQTARLCKMGLDMRVIYFDVKNFPEAEEKLAAKRVQLRELFSEADLVAIHLPLVSQTHHLVDRNLLRLMKPTAYIVNLARGPIWKEEDLAEALQKGWIAGAASDVFEEEPPPQAHPLLSLKNFLATPHSAAHTEESLIRMSLVAEDMLRVLEGKPPQFPVPEEVFMQYGGESR
ncbi:MAG: hydroxyacid dehydrogenase [bacterium]